MNTVIVVSLTLVVLLIFGWILSWTATRVDRLHNRVEGARSALDAQLVRRASAALEFATSGLLDPATAVLLAEAAHEAREGGEPTRAVAESRLTQALTAAVDESSVSLMRADPVAAELLADLESACQRVVLARHLLNDAVASAQSLRRAKIVRWFSLAGHAAVPEPFVMDDEVPPALRE